MQHKTKHDWLLYLSVIWPLGQTLAIQRGQGSQTFCHQSEGLATRDYLLYNVQIFKKHSKNIIKVTLTINAFFLIILLLYYIYIYIINIYY